MAKKTAKPVKPVKSVKPVKPVKAATPVRTPAKKAVAAEGGNQRSEGGEEGTSMHSQAARPKATGR